MLFYISKFFILCEKINSLRCFLVVRLNTIMDSDRIAVLSNGQLVEMDSPQRLLDESKYSHFRSLAKDAGLVS